MKNENRYGVKKSEINSNNMDINETIVQVDDDLAEDDDNFLLEDFFSSNDWFSLEDLRAVGLNDEVLKEIFLDKNDQGNNNNAESSIELHPYAAFAHWLNQPVTVLKSNKGIKFDPHQHAGLETTTVTYKIWQKNQLVTVLKSNKGIKFDPHQHAGLETTTVTYNTWQKNQPVTVLKSNKGIKFDPHQHAGLETTIVTYDTWQRNQPVTVLKSNKGIKFDPHQHAGLETTTVTYNTWHDNQPVTVLKSNKGIKFDPHQHAGLETTMVTYETWQKNQPVTVLKSNQGIKFDPHQHTGLETTTVTYNTWQKNKPVTVLESNQGIKYNETLHRGQETVSVPYSKWQRMNCKRKASAALLDNNLSVGEMDKLISEQPELVSSSLTSVSSKTKKSRKKEEVDEKIIRELLGELPDGAQFSVDEAKGLKLKELRAVRKQIGILSIRKHKKASGHHYRIKVNYDIYKPIWDQYHISNNPAPLVNEEQRNKPYSPSLFGHAYQIQVNSNNVNNNNISSPINNAPLTPLFSPALWESSAIWMPSTPTNLSELEGELEKEPIELSMNL